MSIHHKPNTVSAFIMLFVLTVIGVFAGLSQNNFQIQTQAAPAINFQSKSSLEEKSENYVYFYSPVFLNRNKTQLTIPFSYNTQDAPVIFVGFTPKDGILKTEHLISHPAINNLGWEQIKSDDVILFQKNPQYVSISDFIKNLPAFDTIAVDPTLKDTFNNLKGLSTTEKLIDLTKINFILTRYKSAQEVNGVYYYQNIIDANNAKLNVQNQLEWFVRAPLAKTDNTFLLGHIAIDYLQ